jgi:uncharacterized protein with NRDE domain
MCTIVALRNVHHEFPLIVAANRDEFIARASLPPGRLSDNPVVVGGRDRSRGGTWMGVAARGFFVGVTNQRTWVAADRGLRSRGEVVLACLQDNDTDKVLQRLRDLDARDYNPFNLMFGDDQSLHVAYVRREPPHLVIEALGDGPHVLANDRIGSVHFPKAERAMSLVSDPQLSALSWEVLYPRLAAMLGDHALPPNERIEDPPPGALLPKFVARKLQALCVHTPTYGTVSSTLLALKRGSVAHYLYADGRPCKTRFCEVGVPSVEFAR